MSVLGFCASARNWAPISPVPLCDWLTLMPVALVNSAAAASHQGASVLHSALTTPCACADEQKTAVAPVNAAQNAIVLIFIEGIVRVSCGGRWPWGKHNPRPRAGGYA